MPPPEVVLVGLGPGPLAQLTREAEDVLRAASRVFLRMEVDPVRAWLEAQGTMVLSFAGLYHAPGIDYDDIYPFIADAVLQDARRRGRAVYAVPGHPFVVETPSVLIAERAAAEDLALRVVPGVSYIDVAYALLRLDPAENVQITTAWDLVAGRPLALDRALLISQILARPSVASPAVPKNIVAVQRWLEARFPPAHAVSLVCSEGPPAFASTLETFPLAELPARTRGRAYATLYVPPRAGRTEA